MSFCRDCVENQTFILKIFSRPDIYSYRRTPNDDFVEARNCFRKVMITKDKDHLIANTVPHLCNAINDIQIRQTKIFNNADLKNNRSRAG